MKFFSFRRQYPKWLYPANTDLDSSAAKIKEKGVDFTIDSLNPFSWIGTSLLIKEFAPRLLILPWWHSFWTPQFLTICLLSKLLSKTRILFICHNVQMHESHFFNKFCTRLVLNRGDYFIVHSQQEKINLLKLLPSAHITVVFQPSYEIFRYSNLNQNDAKKKLGITGKVILFFGIVRQYKGLQYLLESMPKVLEQMKDVMLLIVGEFWEDKSIYLNLISRLGIGKNVKIVDQYIPNEDVEIYFEAADLAVFPYISVTGSAAVGVALGFDKPVITTNIGSLPEIVLDGKTGYIIDPANADSLARAVIKFFQGNNQEIIENIKKRKNFFTWDGLVKKIESVNNKEGE